MTTSPKVPQARLGRTATLAVWLIAVLDVLLIMVPSLIGIGALAATGAPEVWEAASGIAIYALTSLYGVLGAVIATRQPRNRIGWLLWLGGTAMALAISGSLLGQLAPPGDSPLIDLVVTAGGPLLTAGLYLIIVFIPLVFPDGSLPSARWRIVAWYAVAGLGLGLIAGLPTYGRPPAFDAIVDIVELTSILAASAAMVLRFRRGDRAQRNQVKWVAAAAGVAAVGFGSSFVLPDGPGWIIGIIGMALLPAAIAIAVLRYRLFEIDRIISRTISWGLVTATLVVAFVGLVIGLTAVLGSFFAGGNTLAVAGSTLVVFALFQPLRRRIQRTVDRRFDRSRYDAERTAAAFAALLRDDVDLISVQDDLLGVVHGSLQPATVALWTHSQRGSAR